MIWFRLKLMLLKLKIDITKIFRLGEKYKIDRRVRLKQDKIEKILTWPVPQNQTTIRTFFGNIQSICC